MAKLINCGFTNAFGDTVTPIEILRYDNNKYVKIRLPSGEEDEVKRGYIYADEALTRQIPQVNWFILGGGNRRNYPARHRKTFWDVAVGDKRLTFATKEEAVRKTMILVRERKEELEVWLFAEGNYRFSTGDIIVTCKPDGTAYQFEHRKTVAKYLRGYGRVGKAMPKIKGVTY